MASPTRPPVTSQTHMPAPPMASHPQPPGASQSPLPALSMASLPQPSVIYFPQPPVASQTPLPAIPMGSAPPAPVASQLPLSLPPMASPPPSQPALLPSPMVSPPQSSVSSQAALPPPPIISPPQPPVTSQNALQPPPMVSAPQSPVSSQAPMPAPPMVSTRQPPVASQAPLPPPLMASPQQSVASEAVLPPPPMASPMAEVGLQSAASQEAPQLTILHFNDVYEVESKQEDPVGGAARFATAVKKICSQNPLIIFSGDCLNPSLLSTITKGRHMISILNAVGVHFAVFGNHEFDFGVDLLQEVIQHMECQWFLSNVFDKFTSEPLGHGIVQKVVEWNNMKIGLMGLVEEEWLDTLATVEKSNVDYIDYVVVANQISIELRAQGAELVIAMTHMKWVNDFRLARNSQGIDLVLGGHDHEYGVEKVNNTWIVKSGSDFKNLTEIHLRNISGFFDYTFQKIDIMQTLDEDISVKAIVNENTINLKYMLEEVLCKIDTDLDGRFATVRRTESNLGNLITNAMLEATRANVALLNSGTLRSDRVHPAGNFTMHDLLSILPLVDPVLVVSITGDVLLKALENGVCRYPALDGRYLQVAGIEFGFYPNAEPGHRVVEDSVKIQGQHLEKNKSYLLAIKEYLANGKDGYVMFPTCPRMFDVESAQILSTIVMNHFESVKIVQGMKKCISGHRMSLLTVSQFASVTAFEKKTDEKKTIAVVPGVKGRIYHVSEEMKESLQKLKASREEGLSTIAALLKIQNNNSVSD